MSTRFLLFLILGFAVSGDTEVQGPEASRNLYLGTCEPSAAVMLEPGLFVVADDDKADLLVYKKDQPDSPWALLKTSDFPGLKKKADLEGAARVGDTIYWIGSHSRKHNGGKDLNRHRLFAIKVISAGGMLAAEPVGKPYRNLISDLQKDKQQRFAEFNLGAAARLPPGKEGGLNIEGLAATPDGKLLIGFRNPIPAGKALIVPLSNPREVLTGEKPSFDDPIELDLGGLGIRSLEYWPAEKAYVISAGAFDDERRFQVFRWSGLASDTPQQIAIAGLSLLVPDAVFFDPAVPTELIILSDDGDICSGPQQLFRSRRVELAVDLSLGLFSELANLKASDSAVVERLLSADPREPSKVLQALGVKFEAFRKQLGEEAEVRPLVLFLPRGADPVEEATRHGITIVPWPPQAPPALLVGRDLDTLVVFESLTAPGGRPGAGSVVAHDQVVSLAALRSFALAQGPSVDPLDIKRYWVDPQRWKASAPFMHTRCEERGPGMTLVTKLTYEGGFTDTLWTPVTDASWRPCTLMHDSNMQAIKVMQQGRKTAGRGTIVASSYFRAPTAGPVLSRTIEVD